MRKQEGFTIIELLVVFAIIGLLATLTIASINTARVKSRDARRISDMRTMVNALEMYFNDNESYPLRDRAFSGNSEWSGLESDLAPYLSTMPNDPVDGTFYFYDSEGDGYGIMCGFEHSGNFSLLGEDNGDFNGLVIGAVTYGYELGPDPPKTGFWWN